MDEKKQAGRRILLFLAITFVITYGIELLLIAPMAGSTDINKAMAAQWLIVGVMFVPTLGVILTRLITKEGFSGKSLYLTINLKNNLKYYAIVWPGFAALIALGAVLYFLLFPSTFDGNMGYATAILNAQSTTGHLTVEEVRQAMLMQIVIGVIFSPFADIIFGFGAEWGFRGYLLPKLLTCFHAVPAVLIDGLFWGLWHAPLVAVTGLNYGMGYVGYPATGILAMCVFCVVIGIILSYVTIKAKSCVPAILGNGMINGFAMIGVYFSSLENPYNVFLGPAPTGLIGGTGFIVLAGFLLFKLYKEEKNTLQFENQGDTIQKES